MPPLGLKKGTEKVFTLSATLLSRPDNRICESVEVHFRRGLMVSGDSCLVFAGFIAYLAKRTKLRFVTFVTRRLKLRVFAVRGILILTDVPSCHTRFEPAPADPSDWHFGRRRLQRAA